MKNKIQQDEKGSQLNNACIVLSDGQCFWGKGFGKEGIRVAEICFNTSMTGYQEILTDLSYAGQIVNFTFPHIGNTGTNIYDNESASTVAVGMITRNIPSKASHWLANKTFDEWLTENNIVGIGKIDTRRITRIIRSTGANTVSICYSKSGCIDLAKLKIIARTTPGLIGKELTADVTCSKSFTWTEHQVNVATSKKKSVNKSYLQMNIVAIDFGAKWTIFKYLTRPDYTIKVVPAKSSFDLIMNLKPDGIFLSNGPGDPKATFQLFGKVIYKLLNETNIPMFGICLGHQLLGLAAGAQTLKMSHGHHGANHPVMDLNTRKVQITSMNHGFAIDRETLPGGVVESHISLFDGSNCGIDLGYRNAFSVQYHPEASPGPMDSLYLFEKFFNLIETDRSKIKIKTKISEISKSEG